MDRNKNMQKSSAAGSYMKAAGVFRALKLASVSVMVLLIVSAFILFRDELTLENLRYIIRYATPEIGTDYRSASQISFDAEPETEFAYLKGDLALLSPTRFSVYEFTGQALVEDRISYLNPDIKTAGRYALLYDVTGTQLALYNSNGVIYEKEFSRGIVDADIRSDGIFAVISSADKIRSDATVYTSSYAQGYRVTSADKQMVSVSLPDGTKRMDLLMFNSVSGDFKCYLQSFDLSSDEKGYAASAEFVGEYPLRMVSDKETVVVLTDRSVRFYDASLNQTAVVSVGSKSMQAFYESGDFVVLTYGRDTTGAYPIRVFTKYGRELDVSGIDGRLISFASEGRDMYFLVKGRLYMRSFDSELGKITEKTVPEAEIDEGCCAVFAKSSSEYILVSPDGAGKFA